jgi:hypothetical protein
MALVDGGSIEVLVVISLQTKESLILSELVPGATAAGLFKAAIESVVRIGNPGLENSLITKSVLGDGRIGSERRTVSCIDKLEKSYCRVRLSNEPFCLPPEPPPAIPSFFGPGIL